jgi:hypothetical protein
MENVAQNLNSAFDSESGRALPRLEVVQDRKPDRDRESLSENFNTELDAWARQAMASNGFGDF